MAFAKLRVFAAAVTALVYNDTAVKNADVLNMTANQLADERTKLMTKTEAFDAKGDKITPVETAEYGDAVDRLEAVVNAISRTAVGLRERRDALSAVSRIAQSASGIVNLSGGISTRPAWEDDKDKYGFRNQTDYLNAVVNSFKDREVTDPRLRRLTMDAIGSDEFSKANWEAQGLMVPRGFLPDIMQIETEINPIFNLMTRVPMTAPVVDIPCRVDKDHRNSVTGGFRVYRGKETAAPELSKSAMEMVPLKVHEVNGAAAVTNQLMADSPISIAALIEQGMRQEASAYRLDELLNGNGIGRPLGMLNSNNAALLTVKRETGQSTGLIVSGLNLLKMRQRVWGYENAVWLCSLDLYAALTTAVVESPNNAGITKLFYPSTEAGKPDTILGRPVIWTEFMNGITSGQDGNVISEWNDNFLACVNPTQVLFGERGTQNVSRSIHVRFLEREEVFLFSAFDDARPWWKATLAPRKAGLTLSPFVVLSKDTA